jgi:hypothetical protein
MKKVILAAVLLAGTALAAMPAQADIILNDFVFRDLGATGFGNAPRLLTLHNNTLESGGTIPTAGGGTSFFFGGIPTVPQTTCTNNGNCGVTGGGTVTGANESLVYSVGALGWFTGVNVGIGLDTNEAEGGSPSLHALTFQTLTLTLYDAAGVALGSFSGNAPVDISQALLDAQQGTGNSVFDLRLDAAQQAQYDVIMAGRDPFQVFEGLRASFGCGAFAEAVCNTPLNFSSTDGAETFLAFNAVPGPVVGAGIPGLMALGMFGLHFWRRRRNGAHLPA